MNERDIELRNMALPLELRNTNGSNMIGGYAMVWGVLSRPLDGFVEVVNRSFTKRSESDGWPGLICRWNHDTRPEYLLGTTRSGTLRPTPDDHGLSYECDLIEQRSDLAAMVARGDISGSSFAFVCYEDTWGLHDGYPLRTLISGRIIDLAPTNDPAYESATCSMRSLAEYVQVDVAEVRKYADAGELGRFLKRTDLPSGSVPRTPLTRAEGKSRLKELGQVYVCDRYGRAAQLRKQLSSKQAQLETLAMALDPVTGKPYGKPLTPQQEAVEKLRQKSRHERELELMAMRWPDD
jgi:uncharacterized protein